MHQRNQTIAIGTFMVFLTLVCVALQVSPSMGQVSPLRRVVVAADGSADYTTIQRGIDALPATGGLVLVKAGVYHESLSIPNSGVTLKAIDPYVILRVDTPNTNAIFVGKRQQSITNVVIEGLHIIGEGTPTWDDGRGIWINRCAHCAIDRLIVENMGSSGIYLRQTNSSVISDSEVFNCKKNGVDLEFSSNDNNVTATYSHDNGANFMVYAGSQRNRFIRCVSSNPYDNGWYIDVGSNENRVMQSRSYNATHDSGDISGHPRSGGSGILIKSNGNIIFNNSISNCRIGIQLDNGAIQNQIIGNFVSNSLAAIPGSGTGILINDGGDPCMYNMISQNQSVNNQRDGIEIAPNASHNSVVGCTLLGNLRYGLNIQGSYNTATGNYYSNMNDDGTGNQIQKSL
jgi:pectin methylesterase-like acyl-CoA thioesterase